MKNEKEKITKTRSYEEKSPKEKNPQGKSPKGKDSEGKDSRWEDRKGKSDSDKDEDMEEAEYESSQRGNGAAIHYSANTPRVENWAPMCTRRERQYREYSIARAISSIKMDHGAK